MTPPTRITGVVAAAAGALALALPATAGAIPSKLFDRTFQQTYPAASKLCAKVAAGTENKRFAKSATQIAADCAALEATYTSAQTSVLTVRNAVLPTLTADRAAVHAACPNPKAKPQVTACVQAHKANDAAIHTLAAQLRLASHTYFASVEGARRTFWAAIHALPGAKHVKADLPIPVPPK
jgi:hypothetical protein